MERINKLRYKVGNEVGYSRAVKVGNMVYVSGTTAVDEQGIVIGLGNAYEQTKFVLEKIDKALIKSGSNLEDVVRTRIYVVDVTIWDEVGRAHGEVFRNIKPASTLVEVSSLIEPDLLVEIEVDAIITK